MAVCSSRPSVAFQQIEGRISSLGDELDELRDKTRPLDP